MTRGVFEAMALKELKSESEMSQSSVVVLRNTWFIRVTVGSVRARCACDVGMRLLEYLYSSFDRNNIKHNKVGETEPAHSHSP